MKPQTCWKEDTLEGLGRGSRVWLRTSEREWRLGTLRCLGISDCSLALDTPHGEGTGEAIDAKMSDVLPANPSTLQAASDLTSLSFLNEPCLLHNLRLRHAEDAIYTHAGPVLVAVNPFKPVELYTPEHVARYVARPAKGRGAIGYEPHIFLIADVAFKQMVSTGSSQSILITGESGAGKTETTKFVMKYLAGLAGGTGMEDRVLGTNPILEAFGNAKTQHNNNSSRFGKLIEIYFGPSHAINGALVQTYLLEKSRVVMQHPGERSYHIFYQLCRGANAEEQQDCCLPDSPGFFAYLRNSGCFDIAGVDDAKGFTNVKAAMAAVDIGPEQQRGIWRVLSAILWLGNIEFAPMGDTDTIKIADDGESAQALAISSDMLGCTADALKTALTRRRMYVGGERITREYSLEGAVENRDALAKAVYEALFRWLVNRINVALAVKQSTETTTSLNILDIYGFECFQNNSFEQLCINYANERLQAQFAAHLFELEQAMYEQEGVDWARVEFEDNKDCVELIEARPPAVPGVFSLLDEECMFPKGSDASYVDKLRHAHASHPRFGYNAKVPGQSFTLHHYAGPVAYNADQFLDKNRDALSPDLLQVLASSENTLVEALAAELHRSNGGGNNGERSGRGQTTVGARFREQLRDLMQRLDQTQLHFVRCIKPNSRQEASSFDAGLILHQLRCCGILEVARIARAGYPTRYLHAEFAERYRILLPGLEVPGSVSPNSAALDVCRRLLDHFQVAQDMYQVAKTKIFFRAGVLGQLEDRAERMVRSAVTVQSTWRMARCRREFMRARAAIIALQACWRGKQQRMAFIELKKRHAAAITLQAAFKTHLAVTTFSRKRAAARAIQASWRLHQFHERVSSRAKARRIFEEEASREAARLAVEMADAEALRRQQHESFEAIKAEFSIDGARIREILGIWKDKGIEIEELLAQEVPRYATPSRVSALQERCAILERQLKEYEDLRAYAESLEHEVGELKEENDVLLQRVSALAIKSHNQHSKNSGQGSVIDVMAFAEGTMAVKAETSRVSEDTVSIMSYEDGVDTAYTGTAAATQAPVVAATSFGRAGPAGAVAALSAELDKKSALFEDDALFIQEVHEGVALGPGMDPEAEFERLLARYRNWQRDFKQRVKATQQSLKQKQMSPMYSSSSSRMEDTRSSTPRASEGSRLTARWKSFGLGNRATR